MTSRSSSRKEIAAAEMTALAAGAGPPENTMPTRRMWSPLRTGAGVDIAAQPTRNRGRPRTTRGRLRPMVGRTGHGVGVNRGVGGGALAASRAGRRTRTKGPALPDRAATRSVASRSTWRLEPWEYVVVALVLLVELALALGCSACAPYLPPAQGSASRTGCGLFDRGIGDGGCEAAGVAGGGGGGGAP